MISLDLTLGGNLRQHKALVATPGADHVQGRFAAGTVERAAKDFAVYGDNALIGSGELHHEPLEVGAKLNYVEQVKRVVEGIVAGNAMFELEEAAQEQLLGSNERRDVRHTLLAA